MKKSKVVNILLLASLYAWLLSFPMQGPVLESLSASKGVDYANYALIFTGFHALGLFISPFIIKRFGRYKNFMIGEAFLCLLGTVFMLVLKPGFWAVLLAVMAVASADYIVRWSHFYIHSTAIVGRIKFMAATIITANIYYGALSILRLFLKPQPLLFLSVIPFIVIITLLLITDPVGGIILEHSNNSKIPIIFILILSNLIFGVFINCGFMNMIIYPYYGQFYNIHLFYESVPYIAALLVIFYFGDRIQRILPVYLGALFIISAFVAFVFLKNTVYSYFMVETFMQIAYAFINVFIWTLLGDASSIYGHAYQIFGYTLFANVLSIFLGGLIGQKLSIIGKMQKSVTGIFSLVIIFLVLSIVPWLNRHIKENLEVKDILEEEKKEKLKSNKGELNDSTGDTYINARLSTLKNIELLTPRELEIVALLLNGCTNKVICSMLYISENTLKIHNRHIYNKLEIGNRKELMQKVFMPDN